MSLGQTGAPQAALTLADMFSGGIFGSPKDADAPGTPAGPPGPPDTTGPPGPGEPGDSGTPDATV